MRTAIGCAFAAVISSVITVAAAMAELPVKGSPDAPIEIDWVNIPTDELLIVTLSGNRQVVVRLAAGFAPEHVANIRTLSAAHWWDGLSVYRAQDNWVAQWGDVSETKPLSRGVKAYPAAEYDFAGVPIAQPLARADAYSNLSGISIDGWPIASDGTMSWLAHCYASVGVARNDHPDTGSGAELFVMIGSAGRRLDRNYSVVGRVIDGMHHFSALPRGQGQSGFYKETSEYVPIVTVRLARDLAAAERPRWQYRAAGNPRFAALINARSDPPAPRVSLHGLDVCDVPLDVRKVPPAP